MRLVVPLALMALFAGCGGEKDADRSLSKLPPCSPGQGRPISEAKLKHVLARRGIHLYRDDRCKSFRDPEGSPLPDAPLATLSNVRSSLDYDRIVAAQGFVECDIHRWRRVPQAALRGEIRRGAIRRVRYEGDEQTYLDFVNVSCAIFPESPGQVDTLEAGLRDLREGTD